MEEEEEWGQSDEDEAGELEGEEEETEEVGTIPEWGARWRDYANGCVGG
jgi:hypothetical protein